MNPLLKYLFDAVQTEQDVKQLRKKILDLAIKGQLVEQRPNEENSIKLVEQIIEKKKRLVTEKKIRKQKLIFPIKEEEAPYKIPSSWTWSRFGSVSINRDGERVPLSKEQRKNIKGEFDYYGASGVIDKVNDYLFDDTLLLIGEDGANLINRSTPIAFIASGKFWVNNHAHVIDSINKITLYYFSIFFNAINLEPYITGTAQPKMNQAKLNSIPIPIPPLNEQQRIVAKVGELFELCDKLSEDIRIKRFSSASLNQTIITKIQSSNDKESNSALHFTMKYIKNLLETKEDVDLLRQGILSLAMKGKLVPQNINDEPASILFKKIEDDKNRLIEEKKIRRPKNSLEIDYNNTPYNIPENWKWVRLNSVFDVRDGTHDTPKYYTEGIPLVTSKNISNGHISLSNVKYISEDDHKKISLRSKVEKGDILFAMIGSIGNPVIVDHSDFSIKNLALFKYYSIEKSNPKYLHYFLCFSQEDMKLNSAGGVQSFVSLNYLREYPFPLPPLAEQDRIVTKIDELFSICRLLEKQIEAQHQSQALLMNSIT